MLGARREEVFAVQVDVRKKVLCGQWAECALAWARNRRGREALLTNGGDDERAVVVVADSNPDSGGPEGGVGRWALVHVRSQCVTARRSPVTGATSPRTRTRLSRPTVHLHHRPATRSLSPRGHKHRRRSNARRRMTTRPMRTDPTSLSKLHIGSPFFLSLSPHHRI